MTPPKTPNLDRILKLTATTTPKSAPSPPLRRGEAYCLSSFARRAEQWYKEEAARQLTQRGREAAAVGRRRQQPSRAAKGTLDPGDYVLHRGEVDSLLFLTLSSPSGTTPQQQLPPDSSRENGHRKTAAAHDTRRLPTPPGDEDGEEEDADSPQGEPPDGHHPGANQGPEARLSGFRARLGRAVHDKEQELRARHDREGGVRHACAAGGAGWDCLDGEYCGHGLVDRCVAWVPRGKAHLRALVRSEMEGFFSSSTASAGSNSDIIISSNNNNNSPERLAELKKGRAAALRAETARRVADVEARLGSAAGGVGAAAAAEAVMLESPTLGRWPAESQGFPREDVRAQRVELAGLAFAVDVCIGDTRILML